jgi:hypothetical protein
MRKPSPDTPALRAIAALEAIPLGSDHIPATTAAREALEQERAAAVPLVFPTIHAAITADAIAAYTHAVDAFSRPTIDRELLQLHAEGLTAAPAVAAVVRTKATLVRLDAALSYSVSDTSDRAARVNAFCRDIACQAVAAGDEAQTYLVLATVLPALEDRINAAVQRHAAHAEEQQQRETEARKARAIVARQARKSAVLDLREWFGNKANALFRYNDITLNGTQYAAEVLAGDNPGAVPRWRVLRAIAARKTHETNYTCPAWQREWAPAEWQAYRSAIEDLKQCLEKILPSAFSLAHHYENLTGAKLAAELLNYEADGSGVAPSSVRKCIAAVQRFDKSYEWRGPNFNGFEIDEEFEAAFNSEDQARVTADYRHTVDRDLAAMRQRHEDDNAARTAFEEMRNQ